MPHAMAERKDRTKSQEDTVAAPVEETFKYPNLQLLLSPEDYHKFMTGWDFDEEAMDRQYMLDQSRLPVDSPFKVKPQQITDPFDPRYRMTLEQQEQYISDIAYAEPIKPGPLTAGLKSFMTEPKERLRTRIRRDQERRERGEQGEEDDYDYAAYHHRIKLGTHIGSLGEFKLAPPNNSSYQPYLVEAVLGKRQRIGKMETGEEAPNGNNKIAETQTITRLRPAGLGRLANLPKKTNSCTKPGRRERIYLVMVAVTWFQRKMEG